MSKFHADLALGEKGERHVAGRLKEFYQAKSVSTIGKGKEYDFRLIYSDNSSSLIEVKTDLRSAKTGNLFFEFQCNGKNSGLAATTSDKWAVLVPHLQIILVFCPKIMLEYLQSSPDAKEIIGGDRRAVRGYIIKTETIRKLPRVETVATKTRLTWKKKAV